MLQKIIYKKRVDILNVYRREILYLQKDTAQQYCVAINTAYSSISQNNIYKLIHQNIYLHIFNITTYTYMFLNLVTG